jgi:Zn finger protein HypA/HybF involved in hydrogenase expression
MAESVSVRTPSTADAESQPQTRAAVCPNCGTRGTIIRTTACGLARVVMLTVPAGTVCTEAAAAPDGPVGTRCDECGTEVNEHDLPLAG